MMTRVVALAGVALLATQRTTIADSDQFRAGETAYAQTCAACHGEAGRGGSGYANPIWGQGARIAKFRDAAGLFEYNQMLMPFDDPTRVSDELKWAVTLYLLAKHGAVSADGTLGPQNASGVPIR